jgi:tetratricopeptide (TPR) repeat protein
MELPLEGAGRKAALLIATCAISAIVIFQASEIWLADYRIHSQTIDEMERGAALLPGDGEAWDLLGHYYQWDFMHSDPPRALADYRHAVEDNPLSADYWMDIASASEIMGDAAGAQRAFERAQAVYPASGEVDFYYGNFLLRRQEYPEAYAQLRRAVSTDPKLLPLAISRVWRASEDVKPLLDQVLPPKVGAYAQALNFFASIRQADAGLAVWERMQQLGKTIPLRETFPFFDELIREDRAEDAGRMWREALTASGRREEEPAGGSVVWNGDFKAEFEEGGLGWRWVSPGDTSIDFDSQGVPDGSRAVRLDFTGGANVDLKSPFEYVPVEPNAPYRFHASMRTDGITTESGIRFAIIDPNHTGAVNVVTDDLRGTQPWTPIDADVTTGPQTHFLLLYVTRYPSRLFDNKLGGTVWIADVSLIPSTSSNVPPNVPAGAAGGPQPR